MKSLPFIKMSGAGNDFIVIDAPGKGTNLKKLAVQICDRTNGVGADGMLVAEKTSGADYRMRIINADGSEAEMCGNGARCFAAYIAQTKKPKKRNYTFQTMAGLVEGVVQKDGIQVHLSDPKDYKPEITLNVNGRALHVSYIDTGVPHTIVFVDNLEGIDVRTIGQNIRTHDAFKPRGTNVNFVEQINSQLVDCRTYERGVEDETKACGTGSVAAALVTYLKANPTVIDKSQAKMRVKTSGGEILEVIFDLVEGDVRNVWLKGSANFIAKGEYYV